MELNYIKPIIAVTGSAGKTMVKTMIAAVLREKWVIFESKDYYNTYQHTKEHANEISYFHRTAVLEYGMAFPDAIRKHCEAIEPNIGVITNVGLAHVGNFGGNIKKLAAAKSELIKGLSKDGALFISADDENSKLLNTKGFKGEIIKIGIGEDAQYQAKEIQKTKDGINFMCELDGERYDFYIPVLGFHNIYNALFAVAVSHKLGFLPIEIQTGLKNMKKPYHRLNVMHLKDNITLIDDTVHAHPSAMKAAIDVLASYKGDKKIAVLGSMTELGPNSKRYHNDIGKYAYDNKIDYLYTFGGYSVNISIGALEAGFPKQRVKHTKALQIESLYDDLISIIKPNTTILVKGASGLNMFGIVRYLDKYYRIK